MKIKFFENLKVEKGTVLIGKTGDFRFKKNIVKEYSLEEGQRFKIGTDSSEDKPKYIYFFLAKDNNGFLLSYKNKSYSISGKAITNELKLELPHRTTIERYTYIEDHGKGNMETMDGFRLCLNS